VTIIHFSILHWSGLILERAYLMLQASSMSIKTAARVKIVVLLILALEMTYF
jgi:hypothetical protein